MVVAAAALFLLSELPPRMLFGAAERGCSATEVPDCPVVAPGALLRPMPPPVVTG